MAKKKRKTERKGGGKQHTFKTQTDAQDVQGQSPWQQDSLFITSMKLEGKEHDCGALVTAVDMCNYRQITYTHTHSVCVQSGSDESIRGKTQQEQAPQPPLEASAVPRRAGGCTTVTPGGYKGEQQELRFSVLAEPRPSVGAFPFNMRMNLQIKYDILVLDFFFFLRKKAFYHKIGFTVL